MNYINIKGDLMAIGWTVIRYGTVFIIGVLLTLFLKA